MSKKLQIISEDLSLEVNLNVRYEKLDRATRPSVEAQVNGKIVKERTIYQGNPLIPGTTQKKFCDEDGNMYERSQVQFFFEGDEVAELSQTKVFEVQDFQALSNYTDQYVIGKFYEIYPDDNGMKKDFDRDKAKKANTRQMRKLWEYLHANNLVARGEFNTSSKGFMASDGYIRAVLFDQTKWGLEIGMFKEAKVFQHLQENVPEKEEEEKEVQSLKKKVLKRI